MNDTDLDGAMKLVARLRADLDPAGPSPETVDRHHRQLEAVIRTAAGGTASPATFEPLAGSEADAAASADDATLLPLTRRSPTAATGRARPSRRRLVAVAAATVVIAGGLFAVSRRGPDEPKAATADPGAPSAGQACGTELAFPFPDLAGFEGPLPGPSEGAPPQEGLSPDTLLVHWRSADAAIDVRWPSYPPLDPTTPMPDGATSVVEEPAEPQPAGAGRWAAHATFSSLVVGPGECSGFQLAVTSGSAGASKATLDQVEMALTGPGGPLEAENIELVVDTTAADSLPPIAEDRCQVDDEHNPNVSGTVEGGDTYPSPREALAFYLAAEPYLMPGLYQEIALPDGSYGYAYRPSPTEPGATDPDAEPVTVLHVAPRGGGWAVVSYARSVC